jgi:alpha-mannosidase
MRAFVFSRLCFTVVSASLIATIWCWSVGAQAQPHPKSSPGILWEIGTPDNSGDEFGRGAEPSLTYDVSKATAKNWSAVQETRSVYRIVFPLERVPQDPPVLVLQGFFLTVCPRGVIVSINDKRGFFRLPFEPGPTLDQRQTNAMLYTRTSLRIPVDPALLRAGANEIGISLEGDSGSLYYDTLRMEKAGGTLDALSATVEPTIFYRQNGDHLTETARVIVRHRLPLGRPGVSLKIGSALVTSNEPGANLDFGESVFDLDVPAVEMQQPYLLTLKTPGGEQVFRGEFRPAKRWKLFAGLKIHNDIGFTDLAPNVDEFDVRNVDKLIGIMERYPFYKFNFDTAWIADNYLHSRVPAHGEQLMALAREDRIGINGLYLNLLSGLCSGEEFYRAMYFTKSLNRKYGVPMKFASLTDTPSQSWSVPSLLADAGIIGFALASNQHRGMLLQNSSLNELSPFYWEGPDGKRVIAWFSRTYHQLKTLQGDKGVEDMRRSIPQFLARYSREDYPVDAVFLYGLAGDNQDFRDGGAPVIARWNERFAYPKLIAATDSDYYEYLSKNFADKLPVIRGDGGSYWTDAAGTSAATTTVNRDTQRLLPLTEMMAGWASLLDPEVNYPADELHDAWKDLLFFDEHSWGAHNSMTQPDRKFVSDQFAMKQGHAVRAHDAANYLLTRAMNHVAQYIPVQGPTLFVFNPSVRPLSDVVETEFETNRQLVNLATAKPVPMDVVLDHKDGWRRIRFLATDVPALGYKAYALRDEAESVPSANSNHAGSWEIESRFYRISLDPATGAVTHLIDKELNRDLVDLKAAYRLNQLVYAAGGGNQRIIRDMFPYTPTQLEVTGQTGARLVDNVRTPLGQRIRIAARAKNVPLIETEIDLYDDLKRIDIRDHIRKDDIRDKEAIYFAFPFRTSPSKFLYQVHNAWARPNEDQLPGALREWFTTQNVVVSRDEGITIAFATPDLPLITLTDINRGRWPTHLDLTNGHVFSYVTNNYWSMNVKASQGGDISFRYSLTSSKDLNLAALTRFDSETRSGLATYPYTDRVKIGKPKLPGSAGSFFELEGTQNAQLSTFKRAEDGGGYILRLRETIGRDGLVRLRAPLFRIVQAFLTNGVEEDRTPLAVKSGEVEVPLNANSFTTVRLIFAGSAKVASPGLDRK